MKKLQRILAMTGVILLLVLHGSTLFFALSNRPGADGWFKASIACTILVPVFLYANTLIYRYLKNRNQAEEPGQEKKQKRQHNETEEA